MNHEQRQRIFEDIIIQRIKVIQNYVKKNVQKFKSDYKDGASNVETFEARREQAPVILSSIHNDGMSLELKIKDAVKWKFEAFEQKQKSKDEKVMMLEVSQNRQEK